MKLSNENLDMQNRIQNSTNKQEVLNLIKGQQGIIKKINMMKLLNAKYKNQYEELIGEKISKKKKKKKKIKTRKKKDNTSSAASTTTEYDHAHCHGHENNNGDSKEEEEEEHHHHCCCGEHHH